MSLNFHQCDSIRPSLGRTIATHCFGLSHGLRHPDVHVRLELGILVAVAGRTLISKEPAV